MHNVILPLSDAVIQCLRVIPEAALDERGIAQTDRKEDIEPRATRNE